MKSAGHGTRKEKVNICGVSVWRPKGKRGYLVDLGVNGDEI
jgi:hypothetical protein